MKILGIDTTKKCAKVFVVDTQNIENLYFSELTENIKHSEGLFLYIEKALLDCRIDLKDIDGFACVVGPGSFTGIRVGMSTIKGLNKVLKKSIISINTFEILLSQIKNGIILLNSTNTSCYYAKVLKSNIIDTGVVDKNNISEFAEGNAVYIIKEEQNTIDIEYNNIKVIYNLDECYVNSILNKLNNSDYEEFVPYYLQLSQAERNIKND